MTDRPTGSFERLGLDLARRMDADCRWFEADWRTGGATAIEDYLVEVPDEGLAALKADWRTWSAEQRQSK